MKLAFKILIPSLILLSAILLPYLLSYRVTETPLPFIKLVYGSNNTEISFTIKGSLKINGSEYIIVEKTSTKEHTTYFVERDTRKIFYLTKADDKQYLGFSGIYTVLWFTKPPKANETVPILDHYGVVSNIYDNSFNLRDYYGVNLHYEKVDDVYVLSSYGELKLKNIVLKEGGLMEKSLTYILIVGLVATALILSTDLILLRILRRKT